MFTICVRTRSTWMFAAAVWHKNGIGQHTHLLLKHSCSRKLPDPSWKMECVTWYPTQNRVILHRPKSYFCKHKQGQANDYWEDEAKDDHDHKEEGNDSSSTVSAATLHGRKLHLSLLLWAGSGKVCRTTFVLNVLTKDVGKPAQTSCWKKAGHAHAMRIMGNKDMILSQRAADPTKTFSSATTWRKWNLSLSFTLWIGF
jgi:hypothetical protein